MRHDWLVRDTKNPALHRHCVSAPRLHCVSAPCLVVVMEKPERDGSPLCKTCVSVLCRAAAVHRLCSAGGWPQLCTQDKPKKARQAQYHQDLRRDSESIDSYGSQTFWNSHGRSLSLILHCLLFLSPFQLTARIISLCLCLMILFIAFLSGGVLIVYERKVKLLYGKFRVLVFMINIP